MKHTVGSVGHQVRGWLLRWPKLEVGGAATRWQSSGWKREGMVTGEY